MHGLFFYNYKQKGSESMAYPQYNYPYQNSGYSAVNQFAPQQPQYQQMNQMPMQSGIICRPVASKEEASQTQIPFDGNPYVFINQMAGEIYTKQFNTLNGNTDFTTFTRQMPERADRYATKEELDALRADFEKMRRPGRKKEAGEDE